MILLLLDSDNEKALKNDEFFKFYVKENVENWLTGEQWDYQEDKKAIQFYRNTRLAKTCKFGSKLVIDNHSSNFISFFT